MNLREIWFENLNWIELAQDVQWCSFEDTVTEPSCSIKAWGFFTD
jgi:hypothetical protein